MASKPRPPGHDGGGKGKGVVVSSPSSPSGRAVRMSSDSKQKALGRSSTAVVKGKSTASSSSKTVTKTTVRAKAQKKVYSLPGQKFDVPEEREPLRIFYESLSKQIPSSEMAEFWLMEHGMLSPEKAKKAYERKQKRQQQIRAGIPVKSAKPERSESSKKLQAMRNGDIKAKKRVNYSDGDDEFIVKLKKMK